MRLNRNPWPAVAMLAILAACDNAPAAPTPLVTAPEAHAVGLTTVALQPMESVGKSIFNDRNLSILRNQSCASCHDAAWGFTSPNTAINAAGSVMPGSLPGMFGSRKPPSAAYATQAPVRFFDGVDGTFVGGNFFDGRATGSRLGSPAAEQALFPFVSPKEQGFADAACVLHRITRSTYATDFTGVFGTALASVAFPANTDALCAAGLTVPLSAGDRATVNAEYDNVGRAVAAFEASPEVNRFSSKYDAYLAGLTALTNEERKGLELYEGKANCAACHPNAGQYALLTDYTYDNIGVPANPLNPTLLGNASFRDLGIGGHVNDPSFNGGQKVPTLRNLDLRGLPGGVKSYMHNGAFKSIEQVVHFYNTRDVLPNCATTKHPKFGENCWPTAEVVENVNVDELGNLGMNPAEEKMLVAYLKTLSDGWMPPVRRP